MRLAEMSPAVVMTTQSIFERFVSAVRVEGKQILVKFHGVTWDENDVEFHGSVDEICDDVPLPEMAAIEDNVKVLDSYAFVLAAPPPPRPSAPSASAAAAGKKLAIEDDAANGGIEDAPMELIAEDRTTAVAVSTDSEVLDETISRSRGSWAFTVWFSVWYLQTTRSRFGAQFRCRSSSALV